MSPKDTPPSSSSSSIATITTTQRKLEEEVDKEVNTSSSPYPWNTSTHLNPSLLLDTTTTVPLSSSSTSSLFFLSDKMESLESTTTSMTSKLELWNYEKQTRSHQNRHRLSHRSGGGGGGGHHRSPSFTPLEKVEDTRTFTSLPTSEDLGTFLSKEKEKTFSPRLRTPASFNTQTKEST
ncbi:hypothetical protein HMI56_002768 [Coelomomyces lativittatus]|nr:hypothetical protein HMI56_002768 [Coelomomyces lativittatus]